MAPLTLTNARIVTATEVIRGTLVVADGRILSVDTGLSGLRDAVDVEDDYVLPGLVELHTDNLEKHTRPRPGVRWPTVSAVLAHDAQMASGGITTVLDAVRLGGTIDGGEDVEGLSDTISAIGRARESGLARADHLLHLRCEVSSADTLDQFRIVGRTPLLRLVSIMDHTPGQRQFVDRNRLKLYYTKKYGFSDEAFEAFAAERQAAHDRFAARYRAEITAICRDSGCALASHDDGTPAHVDEAVSDGMTVAEFPTTLEAARLSHAAGLAVLVGSPNVVLGGSHSGNIAATDLVRAGVADILSSDYVPASLVQSIYALARDGLPLPQAAAMASYNPARAVGLTDRGELVAGLRADFIRVRELDGLPQVREVWREGKRVV
jgi:alpha-D-ribose 1-methylphosphonate 5-triphosphate diphosphatase